MLVVDDAIRDAIGQGASSVALAALAAEAGYAPMVVDGLAKVVRGETSYAELLRVVDSSSIR
jgi:type II secretory ATPase GspE/PulE/Tfp pilus assembly ATPase PilB-like protein